jgi:hypothetical protein
MRLAKFFTTIVFITFFCLLYVYQQAEIFRFGYLAEKKLVSFEELLDKNRILRYNIEKNTSVVQLGKKISQSSDFQMPEGYRLVTVRPAESTSRPRQGLPAKENLASRLFSVRRQAEATTISRPSSSGAPKQ